MSISPQQAFDAIKVLRPNVDRIASNIVDSVRIFDGLWVHDGLWMQWNTTNIEWPEGVTQWPIPEPKWRVPTDEDALKRPRCRVRDFGDRGWSKIDESELIGVSTEKAAKFFVRHENGKIFRWRYCEIMAEVES